jgi:hypothetical protein
MYKTREFVGTTAEFEDKALSPPALQKVSLCRGHAFLSTEALLFYYYRTKPLYFAIQ